MLLCHCHVITDDAVADAVAAGARRLNDVVRGTRAGTGCGGCLPALREACERALTEALVGAGCPAHATTAASA